ncbi:hypothetical protein [Maribellus sediminis]|uniref:hypothetical protein n=1 Tax=Maribellus sediminis TaxID=2696285 RepID=UPI00143194DA|nr:hypothetical protein [Maribellus sediminis]
MKHIQKLKLLALILAAVLMQNCGKEKNNWQIKGSGITSKVVYLYKVNPMEADILLDSAKVDKGKFVFENSNINEHLAPYKIVEKGKDSIAFDFLIANGERLQVAVKDEFDRAFSGTPIAKIYNKFLGFRKTEMNDLAELRKVLSDSTLSEDQVNAKMLIFKEKMQDLENEKIEFLKNIQVPDLNAYLVLREATSTGVLEKELFGKYANALTPEGSMTNYGHKVHRIYEVFDAYALSRELDLLDTATIRTRYNNLEEDSKNSEFAQEVLKNLEQKKQ